MPLVEQKEYSRLKISHNLTSKRKINRIIGKYVSGFDDPRLITLSGLRRRGIPPKSIIEFIKSQRQDFESLLEITRDQLSKIAPRRSVVFELLEC